MRVFALSNYNTDSVIIQTDTPEWYSVPLVRGGWGDRTQLSQAPSGLTEMAIPAARAAVLELVCRGVRGAPLGSLYPVKIAAALRPDQGAALAAVAARLDISQKAALRNALDLWLAEQLTSAPPADTN